MTQYSAFGVNGNGATGPVSSITFTGNFVAGMSFSVTQPGQFLYGYYIWRSDSAQSASAAFALWQITAATTGTYQGSDTSASTAAAVVGQWTYVPLATPFALTQNTPYKAVVGLVNNFNDTHTQFGNEGGTGAPYLGGIVNGPLNVYSAPISFAGTNPAPFTNSYQGSFDTASADPTADFPATDDNSANFWLDVLVGPAQVTAAASTQLLIPPGFQSPMAFPAQWQPGVTAVAVPAVVPVPALSAQHQRGWLGRSRHSRRRSTLVEFSPQQPTAPPLLAPQHRRRPGRVGPRHRRAHVFWAPVALQHAQALPPTLIRQRARFHESADRHARRRTTLLWFPEQSPVPPAELTPSHRRRLSRLAVWHHRRARPLLPVTPSFQHAQAPPVTLSHRHRSARPVPLRHRRGHLYIVPPPAPVTLGPLITSLSRHHRGGRWRRRHGHVLWVPSAQPAGTAPAPALHLHRHRQQLPQRRSSRRLLWVPPLSPAVPCLLAQQHRRRSPAREVPRHRRGHLLLVPLFNIGQPGPLAPPPAHRHRRARGLYLHRQRRLLAAPATGAPVRRISWVISGARLTWDVRGAGGTWEVADQGLRARGTWGVSGAR